MSIYRSYLIPSDVSAGSQDFFDFQVTWPAFLGHYRILPGELFWVLGPLPLLGVRDFMDEDYSIF